MTYTEFVQMVNDHRKLNPDERYGQAMWNVAVNHNESFAELAVEAEVDPFYDDSKVPEFVGFLWGWGMFKSSEQ